VFELRSSYKWFQVVDDHPGLMMTTPPVALVLAGSLSACSSPTRSVVDFSAQRGLENSGDWDLAELDRDRDGDDGHGFWQVARVGPGPSRPAARLQVGPWDTATWQLPLQAVPAPGQLEQPEGPDSDSDLEAAALPGTQAGTARVAATVTDQAVAQVTQELRAAALEVPPFYDA
jgi:hypothetical protein